MLIDNLLVVFDFETNGLNIDTLDPIEVACLALDPIKLSVIPGSQFCTLMRPEELDTVDNNDDKIEAMKKSGITKKDLETAPTAKVGITSFINHVKTICGRKKAIPCGFNISNFDIPLLDRLCKDYKLSDKNGKNPIFLTSFVMDTKEDINRLFFQSDRMSFTSFDNVRKLTGMCTKNVHRAMKDVQQEAWLTKRLLSFYRKIIPNIAFEESARADGGILE